MKTSDPSRIIAVGSLVASSFPPRSSSSRQMSRASSPTPASRTASPPSPRRRDFAPAWLSSSVWSQGGESYVEQYVTSVGSPGQDLGRYTEGPARYLNGTPNTGSKAMLERQVQKSPRGRWQQGPMTGPAMHTQMIMDRKLACRRSQVGPDPYGLCTSNLWTPRTPQRALTVFNPPGHMLSGSADDTRTPWILGRTNGQAFDPCAHARGLSKRARLADATLLCAVSGCPMHAHCVCGLDVRADHLGTRNQWRHTSPSIKSIMAPPMPQTPNGSHLLPVLHKATPRSRTTSPRAATIPQRSRGSSVMSSPRSGNPFH